MEKRIHMIVYLDETTQTVTDVEIEYNDTSLYGPGYEVLSNVATLVMDTADPTDLDDGGVPVVVETHCYWCGCPLTPGNSTCTVCRIQLAA